MLGAWAIHHRGLGREIVIDDTLRGRTAYSIGLLSAIAGKKEFKAKNTLSRFICLTTEQEAQTQLTQLVESVVKTRAAEQIAHYCLADLAQNVFDHACTNGQGAFCSVAFDKPKGRVRLAVADCGKGVPATIKNHYEGDLDDSDSLMLALEPEFSGAFAKEGVNRGVGLYFVRRLTLAANGAFCAITEEVCARASARSASAFTPRISAIPHRWQGTAVSATFLAEGAEYGGPMEAIKDEIEGRGPKYNDIRFFGKSDGSPEWQRVMVNCDRGKFATRRERGDRFYGCGQGHPGVLPRTHRAADATRRN